MCFFFATYDMYGVKLKTTMHGRGGTTGKAGDIVGEARRKSTRGWRPQGVR